MCVGGREGGLTVYGLEDHEDSSEVVEIEESG